MTRTNGSAMAPHPRSPRPMRALWAVMAVLLVVLGTAGSTAAAVATARADTQQSRREFAASTADVVSTLRLAIQHEEDLVFNTAAFIAANPDISNTRFVQWTRSVQMMDRYPELQGVGLVTIVPDDELSAFAARVVADPRHPLAADGTFQPVPPGHRPYYCFSPVGASRTKGMPAGFDYCANHVITLATRDSALATFGPFPVGGNLWLGVGTPVYRGGTVPSTVEARRAAFVGWVGISFIPSVVLIRALQAHPGIAVRLRHHSPGTDAVFSQGSAPAHAQTSTVDLGNGWSAQTFGPAVAPGLPTNGRALAVLLSGLVISVLLGVLVVVLATGRARALRLVARRTEELRHLATHDALTGLPNRSLIYDRVGHALARARRRDGVIAVLFVDLDGFKDVNDTYGHPAGDELLCEIARRMTGTIRTSETVGRLGGDEFVVVLEGESLDAGVEVVAERIRAALAQPVRLDGAGVEVTVGASIGVAVGAHGSEELLREADIAVYEAKRAGKNRYVLFAGS